jgi:hypothetical protein
VQQKRWTFTVRKLKLYSKLHLRVYLAAAGMFKLLLNTYFFFTLLGSQLSNLLTGGSMVARLKLKGIDGRAPPGV